MHVLKLVIPCHAHNLVEWAELSRRFVYTEALAKRIGSFENFAHKRLIHNGNFDRSARVAIVKIAPGEERRANSLKIARAKIIDPRDACILIGTLVDDVIIPGASAKGDKHGVGSGLHARNGLHALDEIAFVFGVALPGKVQAVEIDAGNQDSGLLEANIQGGQVAQTADKKQRTH